MYDDQLDFNRNKLNDFLLIDNSKSEHNKNYIDSVKKENFIGDSLESYKKNQRYDLPEQLDYLIQPAYNYYPQDKPNPLIYTANLPSKTKSKQQRNSSMKSKISTKKTKIPVKKETKTNVNINININNNNSGNKSFNFNSNGKGLFDPNLKKNELGLNKRQEVIKQERLDKIKNYNIKFGKKVENIQIYNNVEDMMEGIKLFLT